MIYLYFVFLQPMDKEQWKFHRFYTLVHFFSTNTFEDDLKGKGTFVQHNRKTVEEYKLESKMQAKQRTGTLYDQRNGLPMCSLGDKVYKAVEYQTGFFKEGGLIVGST